MFSSIQGEGLYVGVRQVFIRFAGCNLACHYCDTPESRYSKPDSCVVQDRPGQDICRSLRNPLDVQAVVSVVGALESATPGHHSISVTGGEPLIQTPFLMELCPELRKTGRRIYLESNGTLVGAMEDLLPHVDIVAMDFKLESATGVPPETEMHREFLAEASGKDVFVKVVVEESTHEEEIQECAAVIALINRRIPLVIQPATPLDASAKMISSSQLSLLQSAAANLLADVRVIPQCHKMLGLR
jgi:7-carboxy-7-deazaguanine synthase